MFLQKTLISSSFFAHIYMLCFVQFQREERLPAQMADHVYTLTSFTYLPFNAACNRAVFNLLIVGLLPSRRITFQSIELPHYPRNLTFSFICAIIKKILRKEK
jgi:hypothetical protein